MSHDKTFFVYLSSWLSTNFQSQSLLFTAKMITCVQTAGKFARDNRWSVNLFDCNNDIWPDFNKLPQKDISAPQNFKTFHQSVSILIICVNATLTHSYIYWFGFPIVIINFCANDFTYYCYITDMFYLFFLCDKSYMETYRRKLKWAFRLNIYINWTGLND